MSRIGFLFPGQGAQHLGMGQQIAAQYPAAAALFARASEILGYDLAKVLKRAPKPHYIRPLSASPRSS